MSILDLINIIVQTDILWVPALLLLMTQVLKVAFAHLDVLSSTIKEVLLTVGTELCVLAISIHCAVLAGANSKFNSAHFGQRVALASVVAMIVYVMLTIFSFMFLRSATKVLKDPIGDASGKEYAKRIAKFVGFEGASIILGLTSLVIVVSTI